MHCILTFAPGCDLCNIQLLVVVVLVRRYGYIMLYKKMNKFLF